MYLQMDKTFMVVWIVVLLEAIWSITFPEYEE
jgi:hypothetical protein